MAKRKRVWVSLFLLMVGVAAAVAVSVTILTKKKKADNVDDDGSVVTNVEGIAPTWSPTMSPTFQPTGVSDTPSAIPSALPSTLTGIPSSLPSTVIATSFQPSNSPSSISSQFPTVFPSQNPSSLPSDSSGCNRDGTLPACNTTTFFAIADVPYSDEERLALPQQILSLPEEAEFLIHLGDIRSARDGDRCELNEYQTIAGMLKLSKVPVFLVVGDNEWNDCSNIEESWGYWGQELAQFEDHWEHNFEVFRPANRSENFAFVHKKALYVGLNLVAGNVHNETEWIERLTEESVWTIDLIRNHTGGDLFADHVRSVVIFGHANPSAIHNHFFLPVKEYIRDELDDDIPVMYMNGDAHEWSYDPSYLGENQMLRIQLTGGTSEPPLQVSVTSPDTANASSPEAVFVYDRRLPLE